MNIFNLVLCSSLNSMAQYTKTILKLDLDLHFIFNTASNSFSLKFDEFEDIVHVICLCKYSTMIGINPGRHVMI